MFCVTHQKQVQKALNFVDETKCGDQVPHGDNLINRFVHEMWNANVEDASLSGTEARIQSWYRHVVT